MTRLIRPAGVLAVLALVLAACGPAEDASTVVTGAPDTTEAPNGGEADTDPVTGLPVIDPLDVTGDIAAAGSSTVFPLSEAVSEVWIDEGGSALTIDSIGSGAGFERFCVEGESDISNASRPIKDEEVEACQAIGREPIEFRVGTDALAVTVSSGNYFAEDITLEDVGVLNEIGKTEVAGCTRRC